MIVEATRVSGLQFAMRAGAHAFTCDQRQEYGGTDLGPMPSELFLTAIASCFGAAVAHVAKKMRVPIDPLRVLVEGEKHEEEFRFARVTVRVEARCEHDRLRRIVELAKKLCFVTNSISDKVELLFELRAT